MKPLTWERTLPSEPIVPDVRPGVGLNAEESRPTSAQLGTRAPVTRPIRSIQRCEQERRYKRRRTSRRRAFGSGGLTTGLVDGALDVLRDLAALLLDALKDSCGASARLFLGKIQGFSVGRAWCARESDQRPTCSTAATSCWARTGLGGLGGASLAERLLDACGHEVVRGMSDLVEGFGDILQSIVSRVSISRTIICDWWVHRRTS